ncbi:hypothetical protein NCAS_0D01760 [Naumovozyma castellii]|uniref:DUF3533 domain-containing protein n=1 Tax=Naumovozyma castellii TaxID=27288 RepID=G0VDW7_NAUCA|nr:hypothetical protein NCAS_0D01760 [Naumovozyma castellii CBS 4309]CCC69757.1 hypothetical protein NCAS_0D01760 [Naumovozyma castellii CBS 4309]
MKGERKNVLINFAFTNGVLAVFCFTIFVLFWGINYRITDKYHRVQILAVIQDEGINNSTVLPMASILPTLMQENPATWHLYNTTSFNEKFGTNSTEAIDKEVIHEVFSEHYWMALNVKPNATQALFETFINPNGPPFNSTEYFQAVFLSARDPSNFRVTLLPLIEFLETAYRNYYINTYFPQFMSNVSIANNLTTVNVTNIALAGAMNFDYFDYRPFTERELIAPVMIGVAYCLLLTFFQFLVYSGLHAETSRLLKPNQVIYYRIIMLWCTMFIASLFFCTTSAIFQVDFTRAFGKGGFVVYWMTTWLFMVACGGTNENAVSLLFLMGPRFLGIWILSFIILNITPTFYPLILANPVYRYGYMMPVHNAIDIYRVIFLDLSKHKMGRNFGLLIAWIAMNTAALPFVYKFVSKILTNRVVEEAQAKAKQEALKEAKRRAHSVAAGKNLDE